MEPRSCGNSRRRPTTRSKILKDVYENEGTNRMLWETKSKVDDGFIPCVDDNPDCDLDDETTLKQLRKRFSTKKREHIRSDEINAVDEESDLNEPLINLKPKRSKTSKSRRKRMKNPGDVSSSSANSANKPNANLVPEGSDPVIRVKVEIPDPEQTCYQNKTPAADEGVNPNETTNEFQNMVLSEYREPLTRGQEYQDYVTNVVQNCVTNEVLDDRVEDAEPISIIVNSAGMSVDSEPVEIECVEFLDLPPLAIQKPNEDQNSNVCIYSRSSSTIEDISNIGAGPQKKLNFVLFEDKTESDCPFELEDSPSSPDKNCNSSSDSIISLRIEENVLSKEDTIADEEHLSTPSFESLFELEDSPSSPDKNCKSSSDSIISSKIKENVLSKEDTIADEEHLSMPSFESHTEGELLKAEEKQASTGPVTDGKSQSSLVSQACNTADIISTPEARLSPENLMSTRKVISPSSEERLCLAMSSVEIWHGADPNKCKGKLFEEQTSKKGSSLESSVQYDKATVNHKRPDIVRQRKSVMSPRHNIKKPQIPKGNIEGPRFSRTLPNLSTDCASIQSCSESAAAFSKQQMHDMESLAVKLMNELKSMKDIVEQKLLFEAYRNVSLKNDADEVKSAINNASKVEETSRKWLSIMSRDCNRFCKIMTMTPNDKTASKDSIVPRETRKIMFADEAGGELCRVKFFEDGPLSDGVKQ